MAGLTKPPYVIKNQKSGFEIELLTSVFKRMGKAPKFVFSPAGRNSKVLSSGLADAMMTVNKQIVKDATRLTQPYVIYQNVAICLKQTQCQINQISDLARYRVAAFKQAHILLGQEYANTVSKSTLYTELVDQDKQVQLLHLRKVDVLIIDINIFGYYQRQLPQDKQNIDVSEHAIFAPNLYQLALANRKDVQLFNETLNLILRSQHYRLLINKYQLEQQVSLLRSGISVIN
ncbi:amino acid ABC transporter substrate-binding protein [Saccharobesus litoralis]|uniref:Amino acid ABC transporter substrate-binding protein n=1 Tax=Saccharobesus litoralis TaxID=2172099 RepID=A0A2S0VMK9_9ALTE|nr:transporter substrate-binding domain-containing protein [Saccharobesus litoralis]AWB65436.1 amino acid ABC transporter substrate-binding protein [Saccharobesus litoralis]